MLTNYYAIEIAAKAHIKGEIDKAAREHMLRQARTGKPAEWSPQAGTLFGLTVFVLAAVTVASGV
ncbi:MAG: hypothetical protein WD040_00275 [Anaerolineales bacterium]